MAQFKSQISKSKAVVPKKKQHRQSICRSLTQKLRSIRTPES